MTWRRNGRILVHSLAGSVLVLPAIWLAASDARAQVCGPVNGGVVACTATGNPYAAGIRYTSASDLALTLNSDVNVVYTGSGGSAVEAVTPGTGSATVVGNSATITSTSSTFAVGLNAGSNDGNATVTSSGTINLASGIGLQAHIAGTGFPSALGSVVYSGAGISIGASGSAGSDSVGILVQNYQPNGKASIDAAGNISGSIPAGQQRTSAIFSEAVGNGDAVARYRSGTINERAISPPASSPASMEPDPPPPSPIPARRSSSTARTRAMPAPRCP